jgi:hypothetical protein
MPECDACEKAHHIYAATVKASQIYGDLAGRFPVQSNMGNTYVCLVYDYDSRVIFSEPTTQRMGAETVCMYHKLQQQLENCGQ